MNEIQILESSILLKENQLSSLYESKELLNESILIKDFNKLNKKLITNLIKEQDKKAINNNLALIRTESQLKPEQKMKLGQRLGITSWIKSSIIANRKAVSGKEFKNATFKTNRNFQLVIVPINFNGRLVFIKRNNKAGTYTTMGIPYGSKEDPNRIILRSISLNSNYTK